LIIVLRLNKRLGIPDRLAYFIGEAVLENFIDQLNDNPGKTILSKVSPPRMEATMFSFFAGMRNFAYMISELSGTLIYEVSGIVTDPLKGCNFSSLWLLVLICHAIIPFIGGVLASFLIPQKRPDEVL
jgi:hypothetical protein